MKNNKVKFWNSSLKRQYIFIFSNINLTNKGGRKHANISGFK